jgi:hypothetical protein
MKQGGAGSIGAGGSGCVRAGGGQVAFSMTLLVCAALLGAQLAAAERGSARVRPERATGMTQRFLGYACDQDS